LLFAVCCLLFALARPEEAEGGPSDTTRRIGTEAALKAGGLTMMEQFLADTMTPATAAPAAAATTTTTPAAATPDTTAPAAAATTTTAPGRPGVCRFFPKGTCKNGDKCTYSHKGA
jgi:hypothetical protein